MSTIERQSDLLQFLLEQGFRPGSRLPTISELQSPEQLGISASKVREQLEVARALGFIEVRSKTGMRMREYSFTPAVQLSLFFALALEPHSFELFTQLRNHIEIAFLEEACELLTVDDYAQLHKCLDQARAKLNPAQQIQIPTQEHREFHLSFFKRLENPFVIGILEAYWEAYDAVEVTRYADYAYHQQVWNYHQRILDAAEARDYDLARQLFDEHTHLIRFKPQQPFNEREKPSHAPVPQKGDP